MLHHAAYTVNNQLADKYAIILTYNIRHVFMGICHYSKCAQDPLLQHLSFIVVLGERTLFFLKEQQCGIRIQKRLDYFPSCMVPYLWKAEGT